MPAHGIPHPSELRAPRPRLLNNAPLSPNHGPRRNGLRPTLIVLHYTAMRSAEDAIARLCDPVAEVSAHYVIARSGGVHALVPEDMRAWHAGAGTWAGQDDINSRSIGIELDNDGHAPFSAPLMDALCALLPDIMARHAIRPEGVIGHSDMAPGRKQDPGCRFDWLRLEYLGLARARGAGAAPEATDFEALRHAAQALGYSVPCTDEVLLRVLRDRYRPHARGSLCAEDLAALPNPAL